MGRATSPGGSSEGLSNPGYNDLNDDNISGVDGKHSPDSIDMEKKKQKDQHRMEKYDADKTIMGSILGCIRGLWATRLTEDVKDDKDLYVRTTLRELVLYLIFLINICIMTLGNTSTTHFYFTNVLQSLFLTESGENGVAFNSITKIEDFWAFVEEPLLDGLYWEHWYNGDSLPANETGYIFFENKLLGVPRVRQVKVRNDSCVIHRDFRDDIQGCYQNFDAANEETREFGAFNEDCSEHAKYTDDCPWKHRSNEELGGISYKSSELKFNYPSGGFSMDLAQTKTETVVMFTDLRKDLWIDRGTRAVFIDFTVYNPNINLFCVIKLVAEMPATGGVITSSSFSTVNLLRFKDGFDYFLLATEIVYMIFILYYCVEEILEIRIHKYTYFKSLWNCVDLLVIFLSLCACAFSVYRTTKVDEMLQELTEREDSFADFQFLAYWETQYNYMMAIVVFLAWIKLFKYISFNTTMNQLSETLSRSAKDLGGFMIMFLIVFLAYTQLGYLIFGAQVKDFSQYEKCIYTLFRIILGDFNFHQLEDAHNVLGPVFFITYVFFVFFVLLNMFLAIINDTYSEVKEDLATRESEFDLGAFLKKGYGNMLTKLNLKKDRLKDIADALDTADLDNDDMVDWEEWRADLKLRGVPDAEIEAVFAKYDIDGDMVLNSSERKQLKDDLLKQTKQLNAEIEDVKDRQEVGETLGFDMDQSGEPEGYTEQSPLSNELLMEKLNKLFVTGEEFNVLTRRVDRIEHHLSKIGSKIDSIVTKLDMMDRQKQRDAAVRDKLFDSLADQGPTKRK